MKNGLDFFRLRVSQDERWELIEAQFGLEGFAVLIKLLQRIYGGEGYYTEWGRDSEVLFARRVGMGAEEVHVIVQAALERGIFDSAAFARYGILTSAEIQAHYLHVVEHRAYGTIYVKYPLELSLSSPRIRVLGSESAQGSPQGEEGTIGEERIGEERKEEDRREEKLTCTTTCAPSAPSEYGESDAAGLTAVLSPSLSPGLPPSPAGASPSPACGGTQTSRLWGKHNNVRLTDEQYDTLCALIPDTQLYIDHFSERLLKHGYHYDSHYVAILRWWEHDWSNPYKRKTQTPIKEEAAQRASRRKSSPAAQGSFDTDDFFRASASRSLEDL